MSITASERIDAFARYRLILEILTDIDDQAKDENSLARAYLNDFASRKGMSPLWNAAGEPEQIATVKLTTLLLTPFVSTLNKPTSAWGREFEAERRSDWQARWGASFSRLPTKGGPSVANVITVVRHACVHQFDQRSEPSSGHGQGIDWDLLEFDSRDYGSVKFTVGGYLQFFSDVMEAATKRSWAALHGVPRSRPAHKSVGLDNLGSS